MLLEQDHTTLAELDSVRTSHDAFDRYSGISWT